MDNQQQVRTLSLISVLLCVLSWELTAAMFFGRWLFGPAGFGPNREWVALSISAALTLHNAVYGWRHLREYSATVKATGQQGAMSWAQAAIVVVMMLFAGAFGTWLFVPGRP